jgi:phospholipid transport system substrate-binding protein
MSPRSSLAWIGAALSLGAAPLPAAADDEALVAEARERLGGAVAEVDAILSDESASPAEKRARIEYRLRRWLDLAFITRAALGSHAEKFSREQYTEFSQEFGRYVVGLYLQRIAREANADFELLDATWDAKTRTAIVHTHGGRPMAALTPEIFRGSPESTHVDYRMRKHRGDWRIVSISIGGVDVVRMFRDQFDAVLRSETPDRLIEQVGAHNTRIEAANPFESTKSR